MFKTVSEGKEVDEMRLKGPDLVSMKQSVCQNEKPIQDCDTSPIDDNEYDVDSIKGNTYREDEIQNVEQIQINFGMNKLNN